MWVRNRSTRLAVIFSSKEFIVINWKMWMHKIADWIFFIMLWQLSLDGSNKRWSYVISLNSSNKITSSLVRFTHHMKILSSFKMYTNLSVSHHHLYNFMVQLENRCQRFPMWISMMKILNKQQRHNSSFGLV